MNQNLVPIESLRSNADIFPNALTMTVIDKKTGLEHPIVKDTQTNQHYVDFGQQVTANVPVVVQAEPVKVETPQTAQPMVKKAGNNSVTGANMKGKKSVLKIRFNKNLSGVAQVVMLFDRTGILQRRLGVVNDVYADGFNVNGFNDKIGGETFFAKGLLNGRALTAPHLEFLLANCTIDSIKVSSTETTNELETPNSMMLYTLPQDVVLDRAYAVQPIFPATVGERSDFGKSTYHNRDLSFSYDDKTGLYMEIAENEQVTIELFVSNLSNAFLA